MTATIHEFKRPNNDGVIDDTPADSALCCDECMGHSWALRADSKMECLNCCHVLKHAAWSQPVWG